jgi:hypothetical protein
MTTAVFYRAEAERCRKRAAEARDLKTKARLLQLADEYDQLAASLQAPPP